MSAVAEDATNAQNVPPPLKKAKVIIESTGSADVKSSGAPMYREQKASNVHNGGDQDGKEEKEKLNSNLYSRQMYGLGESAMYKLRQSKVLVSGLGSVGNEIAKNLILGGVRHVTLHDTKNTEWKDLSAQYYLNEKALGVNRASACFAALEELNDSVLCTLHTDPLTEEFVKDFDLVILTDAAFDEQKIVNQWTRNHKRYFISADARGLFSYSFVDLGEKFRIDDTTGDAVKEVLIEYVEHETGNVITLENSLHNFEDGDYVTFTEVKGMVGLNDCEPRKARGNLQPVASIIGGLTAQEAMKAVTHHTTPQKQFLFTHHLEALPGDYSSFDNSKLTAADCAPQGNRYDAQAAVFGWAFQEALSKQKWFIVGSGAIGCELLKNFAMIGLGCGDGGYLKITDMDQIELSNLNRQFLFRHGDIGGKKSEVAAKAVKQFNPKLNITALSERVADDTENVFDDDFFEDLSGVANALDNVDARRYMDRRCVFYEKPLLESGTMGAKGNTQVVYPHVTESYSSTNDPPEKETPICTLKNFPYEIHHTIQWARGLFEDLFTVPAEKVNTYLSDMHEFWKRMDTFAAAERDLRILKQILIDEKPNNAEDCIIWAMKKFDHYYRNDIFQLLHNFPAGHVNFNGIKFWSGTKRCPHVLNWDPNNQYHFDFVYAASILRAEQFHLKPVLERSKVIEIASAYTPEPFVPKRGVIIPVTEAEAAESGEKVVEEIDDVIFGLKLALARLQLTDSDQLKVIDFEKDDDTNHHIEFVTAASNLRAENYDIPLADAMKTKQIAGRIIPAIATTTSVVAGLVTIELYKCVESDGQVAKTPAERFKNGFLNLASTFYTFSEPGLAPKKVYNGIQFTLWDRIEIRGPITLRQLKDTVESQTKLSISMLSCGVSLLYAFFHPPVRVEERMAKNVVEAVEEVSRKAIPAYRKSLVLDASTNDDNDEDVEIPFIKYVM